MKALLLSIKPEYVETIVQGTKKVEYRKRLAKEEVSVIYIYSTAPSMKVVASVEVVDRLVASPTKLWEQTQKTSGVSRVKYFSGCKVAHAYKLGKVKIFKSGKKLSDFGISTPPQSFKYIDV